MHTINHFQSNSTAPCPLQTFTYNMNDMKVRWENLIPAAVGGGLLPNCEALSQDLRCKFCERESEYSLKLKPSERQDSSTFAKIIIPNPELIHNLGKEHTDNAGGYSLSLLFSVLSAESPLRIEDTASFETIIHILKKFNNPFRKAQGVAIEACARKVLQSLCADIAFENLDSCSFLTTLQDALKLAKLLSAEGKSVDTAPIILPRVTQISLVAKDLESLEKKLGFPLRQMFCPKNTEIVFLNEFFNSQAGRMNEPTLLNLKPIAVFERLSLASLKSLKTLSLHQGDLALKSLKLSNLNPLDCAHLKNLGNLETLILNRCTPVNEKALAECKTLQKLTVRFSPFRRHENTDSPSALSDLKDLNSLKTLILKNHPNIDTLQALPEGLENLELKACQSANAFEILGSIKALKHFKASWINFKDLKFLSLMKAAESITLENCSGQDLSELDSALANLGSLKSISVNGTVCAKEDFPIMSKELTQKLLQDIDSEDRFEFSYPNRIFRLDC